MAYIQKHPTWDLFWKALRQDKSKLLSFCMDNSLLKMCKSRNKFIIHPVPSPWGASVGLYPQTKLQAPPNWNVKHYKSVEFLSIFRMSSPPAQMQSAPASRIPYWKFSGDGAAYIWQWKKLIIWCKVLILLDRAFSELFGTSFNPQFV